MEYKHNQKVTCEIHGTKITDARISIDENGQPFICQNEQEGANAENKLGYNYSWGLYEDFTAVHLKNLRPAFKSFDFPEIGDKYKDGDGDTRVVLGVAGRAIFLSSLNNENGASSFYTKEGLVKYNYTIVQDEPEEEIEEMTVAEVCKRLGKQIKIIK
jgi:hypothetical protein